MYQDLFLKNIASRVFRDRRPKICDLFETFFTSKNQRVLTQKQIIIIAFQVLNHSEEDLIQNLEKGRKELVMGHG